MYHPPGGYQRSALKCVKMAVRELYEYIAICQYIPLIIGAILLLLKKPRMNQSFPKIREKLFIPKQYS